VRDKLGASIGGDIRQHTMLGEYMDHEQFCQLCRSNCIMSWNEYALLRELIYNNKDGCVAFGLQKVLNEIHRDGVPQMLRNQKLFEKAIRLVML
jgi:hypothetical protein